MKRKLLAPTLIFACTFYSTNAAAIFGIDDLLNMLLSLYTGPVSAFDNANNSGQLIALGKVGDSINKLQSDQFEKQLEMIFDPISNLCNIDDQVTRATKAQIAAPAIATATATKLNTQNVATTSTFTHAQKSASAHNEKYCTKAEVDEKLCSTVGTLPGADVTGSLLTKTNRTEQEQKAIDDLLNNLSGTPSEAVLPAVADTTAGKDARQNQLTQVARLSLANDSLSKITAEYTKPGTGAEDLSVIEALNEEADSYYLNPQFLTDIQAEPPATLARRNLRMQAFIMKMMVKQYEQSLRAEALIATQLIDQVKVNSDKTINDKNQNAASASH